MLEHAAPFPARASTLGERDAGQIARVDDRPQPLPEIQPRLAFRHAPELLPPVLFAKKCHIFCFARVVRACLARRLSDAITHIYRHGFFCEFARRAPHEPCAAVLIGNLLESRENVPSSAPSSLLTLIIMSCGRQVVHIDIIGKRCALLPPAHRPHTHTHCPCCRRPRKGQQEGLASTSFCMAVCMSSRMVHSPISTCMHIYKCVLARTRLFTCALRRVAHVLNC